MMHMTAWRATRRGGLISFTGCFSLQQEILDVVVVEYLNICVFCVLFVEYLNLFYLVS